MLSRAILLLLIGCCLGGRVQGKSCPYGFLGLGNSCYLFAHSATNFEGAHAFCDYFSSHLARITNSFEEFFNRGHLLTNGKGLGYFVDGTDMRVEGVWTWDKPFQKMTYLNWYPGRPNGYTRQNCLALWSSFKYRLVDIECELKLGFVCETQKK